jgi:MFS superfamily sulfate permease-like transporter
MTPAPPPEFPPSRSIWERFLSFILLIDARYEDLTRENWGRTVYRDFSAGLVVALTAIPMAMGFAMAMGMRPEQGIIAGALACVVGRTWGGSKYQVYGPTAAFIPVIAGLIHKYGEASGGTAAQAQGVLVFVSMIAGALLMLAGLLGMGKFARLVPPSVVVGFTVGIGISIAFANAGEALGIAGAGGGLIKSLKVIAAKLDSANYWALAIALLTFGITKILLRISIFIPAPLLALGAATVLSSTLWSDKGIVLLKDRYGSIPTNFFVLTPPQIPALSAGTLVDIAYFVVAIFFVSGIESLLCSSMADRLANNQRTQFDPDREFWGQGLVQIITPLVNGFPCTGALARTATSIKAGALTPLAGYFKAILKLSMAYMLAKQLEMVPMACIAGILLWVSTNMIKVQEIREILKSGRIHTLVMVFTAVLVPTTDFLTGVISALILHALLSAAVRRSKAAA